MPDFDFSELMKLAADLGEAEVKVVPFVRKAVEFTATNVKKDWRDDAKKQNPRGVTKRFQSSIDYDMKLDTDGSIGAEVGPNLGRFGGSWGFIEDAPGDVHSAPQESGRKAAKKNEADFVKGLLQAGEDALK